MRRAVIASLIDHDEVSSTVEPSIGPVIKDLPGLVDDGLMLLVLSRGDMCDVVFFEKKNDIYKIKSNLSLEMIITCLFYSFRKPS